MLRLQIVILFLIGIQQVWGQSPHGEALTIDCASCHQASGWTPLREPLSFSHDTTNFPLENSHVMVDCKSCHTSLVFEEASQECVSCHTDIHSMSVGNDCIQCHNTRDWIVDYIPELHEENGFPLVGSHSNLSCVDCHVSETTLRFDRLGNDCINCHQEEYLATTSPNHQAANYSTDCIDCHSPLGTGWNAGSIIHDFFPLTGGHDITDCAQCHDPGTFSNISPECVSCHLDDYNATNNPDHQNSGFSTNCIDCHNITNWNDASFDHDASFPIYTGKHEGEWNECSDCHTDPGNFMVFSCIDCHEHDDPADLADKHDEESDYVYESNACFSCHPTGEED